MNCRESWTPQLVTRVGSLEHPTYKEVCTDRTGHAEVVEVTFDPSRIRYEALLDTFLRSARPDAGESARPGLGVAVP